MSKFSDYVNITIYLSQSEVALIEKAIHAQGFGTMQGFVYSAALERAIQVLKELDEEELDEDQKE